MTKFYFTSAVVATFALSTAHAIIQPSVTHEEGHVVLTLPINDNEDVAEVFEQGNKPIQSPITQIADTTGDNQPQLYPTEQEIRPFLALKPVVGEEFRDLNGIVWTVSDVPNYLGAKLHNFDVILLVSFRDKESQAYSNDQKQVCCYNVNYPQAKYAVKQGYASGPLQFLLEQHSNQPNSIEEAMVNNHLQQNPTEDNVLSFLISRPEAGEEFHDNNGIVWSVSEVPDYSRIKYHNFRAIPTVNFLRTWAKNSSDPKKQVCLYDVNYPQAREAIRNGYANGSYRFLLERDISVF